MYIWTYVLQHVCSLDLGGEQFIEQLVLVLIRLILHSLQFLGVKNSVSGCFYADIIY